MAGQRLSKLQRRILALLLADHHRTQGLVAMGHSELVKAIGGDKGNASHSLRRLENRGWIAIGRTPGGKAEYVYLTPEGLEMASQIGGKL